jgi:GNAT superfamily N-acetyltransferase
MSKLDQESDPISIWALTESDLAAASHVLTRAFADDPFFTFSIPDSATRMEHLPPFFETCLRYGTMYGRVFGAGRTPGVIHGVAWWYRFPEFHYDESRAQAAGFGEIDRLLGDGSKRIELVSRAVDLEMERTLPQPRANLDQIGVDPSAQGSGIGSALVRHVVEEAASEGLPVALWTDSQENVSFYQHHGFDVGCDGSHAPHGVAWWAMFRPRS